MPTKHGPKPTLEPRLACIPSMLAGSQAEFEHCQGASTEPSRPKDQPEPSRVSWLEPHSHLTRHCAKPLLQARESPMDTECLPQACVTWELYVMADSLPLLLKPNSSIEMDHSPLIKRETHSFIPSEKHSQSYRESLHRLYSSRSSSCSQATIISFPCTSQRCANNRTEIQTHSETAFQYLFKVFFSKNSLMSSNR